MPYQKYIGNRYNVMHIAEYSFACSFTVDVKISPNLRRQFRFCNTGLLYY
jgi:hypothetical protein